MKAPAHTVDHPTDLFAFLCACHPGTKRTKLRQWLKFGSVHVNDRPVTRSNHRLQTGDRVSISRTDRIHTKNELPRGLQILYEDDSLIVVNKPANLLSMASASERHRTAYALLMDYVRGGNPGSRSRVWIVHRLDRETSGLMVFARTEAAKRALQGGWRRAEKRYLAIVEGHPPAAEGELRSHLDERHPFKVHSRPARPGTREAVTGYRIVRRSADRSLLELTLKTGRRHQIRVQLADLGCPVIGDRKYRAETDAAGRLGLHASYLQFDHPLTGEPLRFESPLPGPLARLV